MSETYQRPSCSTAVTGSDELEARLGLLDSLDLVEHVTEVVGEQLADRELVAVDGDGRVGRHRDVGDVVDVRRRHVDRAFVQHDVEAVDAVERRVVADHLESLQFGDQLRQRARRTSPARPGRSRSITPRRSSWSSDSITASPSSWGLAAPPLLSPDICVTANTPAAPIASTPTTPPISTFLLDRPRHRVGPSVGRRRPLPLSAPLGGRRRRTAAGVETVRRDGCGWRRGLRRPVEASPPSSRRSWRHKVIGRSPPTTFTRRGPLPARLRGERPPASVPGGHSRRGVYAGRMRIAVTGATGLIGSALVADRRANGDDVVRVVAAAPTVPTSSWSPADGTARPRGARRRRRGRPSRGRRHRRPSLDRRLQAQHPREPAAIGTALIAKTIAGTAQRHRRSCCRDRPSASTARGATSSSTSRRHRAPGSSPTCASPGRPRPRRPRTPASRVAHLRSGVVLSADGGALKKQLPLFKFGLGGKMGSGEQWQSWISIDDEVGAIVHLLSSSRLGPGEPHRPESGDERRVHRLARRPRCTVRPLLPIPKFGPRLLLGGELADNLLFTGQKRRAEAC